ncbi:adenine phosphoribosyltransferase [Geitlerinema sp. PCC 9228]|jgi:adenine phosphoribosyltransferase|uniref:adenine phosphoribosyltransferase n=1 Tax=Geitlerinema sp. PCC 9228 TaxID=111611 RepID=UPI0008F9B46B|nr:adenine phosphoribosyltransferase [Geitlerinema sp. PCC 9228]
MDLKSLIRDIPDFPEPGIIFRDITPLLRDPQGLRYTIDALTEQSAAFTPDCVVGIESRGFMFGVPIAQQLGVGFIPVRKSGKLPAEVHSIEYELEYGKGLLEIHKDALCQGDRVLILDDLLATGGTAKATADMVEKTGAQVAACVFVIELLALEGRKKFNHHTPVVSLIQY